MSPWEGIAVWVMVSVPIATATGSALVVVRRRATQASVALADPSTFVLAGDREADAETP